MYVKILEMIILHLTRKNLRGNITFNKRERKGEMLEKGKERERERER